MRQMIFMILLLISAFVGFTGYCYAWVDWVQDVKSGIYERNYLEVAEETSAISLYTYFAIRFVKRKVMQ